MSGQVWIPLLVFLFLLGSGFGCSSKPKPNTSDSSSQTKRLSGTDEQIFVGDSLEMNYDPNVIMKRAESFYEKESFAEALVEYQHFLDLHRSHVLAPYAQYKLAFSHFKMFKTIDRDPAPLTKAQKAFEDLLTAFPGSRHEKEAKGKIKECKQNLAKHHLFVGDFYYRKESYLAAAHRFELVINTYPELELAANAKFQLAQTYQNLGIPEWSRDWLIALIQDHSNEDLRKKSRQLLADLQKDHPDLVVAKNLLSPQVPEANVPEDDIVPEPNSQFAFIPPQTPSPLLVKLVSNPSVNGKERDLVPSVLPTTKATSPTVKECDLGTWCESANSASVFQDFQNDSSLLPSDPPIKTCNAGQWC